MVHFDPDIAPAMRNRPQNTAEALNEKNRVQYALMLRYPEGDTAWSERYNRAFRALFDQDDFHSLVLEAHSAEDEPRKSAALTRIQDWLEKAVTERPELLKGEFES